MTMNMIGQEEVAEVEIAKHPVWEGKLAQEVLLAGEADAVIFGKNFRQTHF